MLETTYKRSMKTVALALLFLSAIAGQANSQTITQTVRGTVADKQTQITLPGATVIVKYGQQEVGTITDEDGNFKFSNIPIGRITLRVSYVGYQESVTQSLSLLSGKELVLNVGLEEKVTQVEGVIVKASASKTNTINKMSSVSARTFTVEETERYAGSRNDVARMASNYAGVSGVNDARNDIIIRGNSPTSLLWRLEGVDIPNPNHYAAFGTTGGPVSMLNNTMLANSDFMTSAFPAEYGNAIAGVFDLKMRVGNNEKYEFLGQMGFNGVEFGAEGPISRMQGSSFLINYRYSTLSLFDKMGIDLGTGGIPYYQDLSFKLNFPRTPVGHLSIFGLGGKSTIDLWDSKKDTTQEKVDFYGGEGFDLTNSADMGVIGITQQYIINETTFTHLTVAGIYHQTKTIIDSLDRHTYTKLPVYRQHFSEDRAFISFFLNKKFNRHHSIKIGIMATDMGFALLDSSLNRDKNAFETTTNFDGSAWEYQPYAQWHYRVNDELTLNSGVHLNYFAFNQSMSVEPRLGLRYKLASNQSISLGYGLHSQLNPITVYFRQVLLPNGSYERTNENLKMVKSQHFVAAYDWTINNHTRIKVESYLQLISNAGINAAKNDSYSILNEGANFYVNFPDSLKNGGTGKNYGVELTAERFLSRGFYFLFTSSLFQSRYKGSDGIERNTAFNGNYIFNLLLGKEFKLTGNSAKTAQSLAIDIKSTVAGGQRYTPFITIYDPLHSWYNAEYLDSQAFEKQYPNYKRTDIKITYRRSGRKVTQEWAIDITNLFNTKNIYTDKFNRTTGERSYTYQLGMLIVPQYRIIF